MGPGYGGGILRAKILTVLLAVAASVIPVEYGAYGASGDTAAPISYARYFLGQDVLNSPATQASRWSLFITQGDQAANARAVKAVAPSRIRTEVYANPLFLRQSDPDGVTTTTRNFDSFANHPEWFLLDSSGRRIPATNFSNEDYAADIGSTSYQKASIAFLLAKMRTDGWDGVFLDDTNPTSTYAFSARPAKYPTDASWQKAEVSYVKAVCGAIEAAGKRCNLNLGQRNTTWAKTISRLSDGPMTEFFVAMDPSVGYPTLATVENGYWPEQLAWAKWAETNTSQQIVHASTDDPNAVAYALASYLLVWSGRGTFSANRDYTSLLDGVLFPQPMTDATQLGAPTGAYVADPSGVYYRTFAHGSVVVNPHNTARTFRGVSYAASSGVIKLTG